MIRSLTRCRGPNIMLSPAFPQIIVKGELVGGLDILKELIASGEFAELTQETSV